jgi:hypothetical protein
MAAVDVQHPVETTYVPAPWRDLPIWYQRVSLFWAMANGRIAAQPSSGCDLAL